MSGLANYETFEQAPRRRWRWWHWWRRRSAENKSGETLPPQPEARPDPKPFALPAPGLATGGLPPVPRAPRVITVEPEEEAAHPALPAMLRPGVGAGMGAKAAAARRRPSWILRLLFGETRRTAVKRSALLLTGFAVLYFGVGSALMHRIDNDTSFRPPAPPAGASHTIAMAVALIEREVVHNSWLPAEPWFMPGGILDNTPNFQRGIMAATGRFVPEVLDHLGRARGSSRADPDLERAAGFLQFPPDVWHIDFSKSWMPAVPSAQQYRAGARALAAYNQRLATGQATFDRRVDSLAATVQRVAVDLGSQSAIIYAHLANYSGRILHPNADDLFFQTKGRLYAYYLLLREMGRDFERVIQERNMEMVWFQAMDSLRYAASLHPAVIMDGSPKALLFSNHLAVQGFHLLRALVQLNEVVKVATVR